MKTYSKSLNLKKTFYIHFYFSLWFLIFFTFCNYMSFRTVCPHVMLQPTLADRLPYKFHTCPILLILSFFPSFFPPSQCLPLVFLLLFPPPLCLLSCHTCSHPHSLTASCRSGEPHRLAQSVPENTGKPSRNGRL